MRHIVQKILGFLLLISLIACTSISSKSNSTPIPEYLVLISIDAGRPEYLDLVSMPNLQSLLQSGVYYPDAWVGSVENNTPPGHTEMATGSFPRTNGILGFSWTNVENGQKINPTSLEAINRGEMAAIVQQSGVPTLSGLIKAKYPDGKVIVVTSHKYYAAQGLGVGPSDYILYAENIKKAKQSQAGQGVELPSAGMLVPVCLNGHELPADVLADPALSMLSQNNGDDSRFVFNAAKILFEKYQPHALLINLPETDSIGHKTGGINAPEEIRLVMEAIDAGLGELISAYKKAGIFDKTLWVITADHGMTPNTISVDGQAISQSSSLICPRCKVNSSTQFLSRPELAIQVAVQVANAEITGVTGVYARVKKEGVYQYQAAQKTSETLDPDLNEAYLYLLSTFAGPNSPDIAVASNTNILGANDAASKGGKHSAMNWADQHIPLIISGPGVTGGKTSTSPARLADILPTIARLMTLDAGIMDGVVLSDALIYPQPMDTEAQNVINDQLTPLRDALKKTTN
jgi:hypothetical protein